jgi:hypothetical protein
LAGEGDGEDGVLAWERIHSGEGCDACGRVRKRMAVDHNHRTGKVRGILCSPCNTTLGLMGEDPERMHLLIGYLKGVKNDDN